MPQSYLIIICILVLFSFLLDIKFSKVLLRYPSKLLLAWSFLTIIFFMRVYIGVKMNLWAYGSGTLGRIIDGVPIEEYIYILVAPYSTIVLWESMHKIIRKK